MSAYGYGGYSAIKDGKKAGYRHIFNTTLTHYRAFTKGLRSGQQRSLFRVLFALILVGLACSSIIWLLYVHEYQLSYCDDDMLVVNVVPNALDEHTFQAIRNRAMAIKTSQDENNLHKDLFKDTSGIVLKFNRDGLKVLSEHELFQTVKPFFLEASSAKSNAYVLNVLIAKPTGVDAENDVVGMHVDDTVAIADVKPNLDYVAYRVSVLYLQVPNGMQGGEFVVNSMPGRTDRQIQVKPATGTMVQFRGDLLHQVHSFDTPNKEPRVSLVLEEYKIPEWKYPDTYELCVNDECIDEKLSMEEQLKQFNKYLAGKFPQHSPQHAPLH